MSVGYGGPMNPQPGTSHEGPAHPTRIAVVGAGAVGSSFAFALLLSGLTSEIVLIDANERKAEGEAMDLMHAVPFARTARVWAGDVADCRGAAVTVITAGAAQRPGESRMDLVTKNAAIVRALVPSIAEANPDGIIVVATNPVDVLSYLSWSISGLPPERVIGSGTILDTARFRMLLADHYQVDPRSVHAFIAGEHGDSEVPVWSSANIAGMPLREFGLATGLGHDPAVLDAIFTDTRDAAYQIIERKGATYYAVAAGLVRLVAGDPAGPAHRAFRQLADPRLLRDLRRVPLAAGRRRERRDRADPPAGAGRRVSSRACGDRRTCCARRSRRSAPSRRVPDSLAHGSGTSGEPGRTAG